MRIAVIGAGAMGSIYGGHLSLHNDVYLVDTNPNVVAAVNENGLKLQEYGTDNLYHPKAVTSTEGIEPVDLIILFVKALFFAKKGLFLPWLSGTWEGLTHLERVKRVRFEEVPPQRFLSIEKLLILGTLEYARHYMERAIT